MNRRVTGDVCSLFCALSCVLGLPVPSSASPAITNQRVTTSAPPASGCIVPPPVTSFSTTDSAVYLFFNGTVSASDNLTNDWRAPNGDVLTGGRWNAAAGSFCFTARPLAIVDLAPPRLGSWQARVYDNGSLLFSVPFTVSAVAEGVSISGIVTQAGTPLSGVALGLTGTASLASTSDANGSYAFAGLAKGGNYTVTPALNGYSFSPAALQFSNMTQNQTGNFTATLAQFTKAVAEPSGTPFLPVSPTLACPGYYTAVIGLYPGARDGIWGTEIQLSAGQRYLQGGVNLGGGFAANGGSPGFAAFNIYNPANEPQTVGLNMNAQPLAGATNSNFGLTMQLLDANRNPVGSPIQKTSTSGPIAIAATQTLPPGFYVLSIQSTSASGAGTFQLSLSTQFTNRAGGAFQGGVVVGGYLVSGASGAAPGFAGFCISDPQTASIAAYSSYLYGDAGAGAVTLQVDDVSGKQFWVPPASTSAVVPQSLLRATEILKLRDSQF